MNIAVYCGSSKGNKTCFREAAEKLGAWIGSSGNALVYGGAAGGLMGILADKVLENGGAVTGVLPDIPLITEKRHQGLTECIITPDMTSRKKLMIEKADAFVALPGGPGTLDELTEIMCLQRVGVIKKPLVLINSEGYYEPFRGVMKAMTDAGFVTEEEFEKTLISEDMEEIEKFLMS